LKSLESPTHDSIAEGPSDDVSLLALLRPVGRQRETSCGPDATSDAIAGLVYADPAKALVIAYFRWLVADWACTLA